MQGNTSYVFLEAALVATVYLFTLDTFQWRAVIEREFLLRAAILFVLWFVVDQIALALGVWSFPPEGTLPIRIAQLPLELVRLRGLLNRHHVSFRSPHRWRRESKL